MLELAMLFGPYRRIAIYCGELAWCYALDAFHDCLAR
jgi:hypothetical protein